MFKFFTSLVVAGVIQVAGSVGPAWAISPSGPMAESASFLALGAETAIPSGYYQLCRSRPALCAVRSGARGSVTQGGQLVAGDRHLQQLAAVNASVNATMHAVEDRQRTGVDDQWSVGGSQGDCEDFALTKRQRLIAMGWPANALLIALVRTRTGEEHAVLVARTTRGDYVLDNLRSAVLQWNETGYYWDKIQSPYRAWAWHRL